MLFFLYFAVFLQLYHLTAQDLFSEAEQYVAQGNCQKALEIYSEFFSQDLSSVPSMNLLLAYNYAGQCSAEEGDVESAVQYLTKAVELYGTQHPSAFENVEPELLLFNLAYAHQEMGNIPEAYANFQRAIDIKPDFYEAYIKLAYIANIQGDINKAAEFLVRAIEIRPENEDTYLYLGDLYNNMKQFQEAIKNYEKALEINPQSVSAHFHIADSLYNRRQYDEAYAHYRIASSLTNHRDPQIIAALLNVKLELANWKNFNTLFERLHKLTAHALREGHHVPVTPYHSLFLPFSGHEQRMLAEIWSLVAVESIRMAASFEDDYWKNVTKQEETSHVLKIGYISRRFEDYPGTHLMLRIFAAHNRNNVKVFAYARGPDDGSEQRQIVKDTSDVFRDLSNFLSLDAAKVIAEDQLDVLVDYDGAHSFNNFDVLILRPAKIQATWLGYPGTTGLNEEVLDYIIADPIVIPASASSPVDEALTSSYQPFYDCLNLGDKCVDTIRRPFVFATHPDFTEKVAFLPNTYQPRDHLQVVSDKTFTRQDFDLPEDAFVFACFNRIAKVDPSVFGAWMRILQQVPNSVLWLLTESQTAQANLRKEAESAAVDPSRIIFSQRLPRDEHLKRHELVDLFLDTFYYGAHTTLSDALSMGVPVVTLYSDGSGHPSTFANRVGTSLIDGVGLTGLEDSSTKFVASSVEEYVNSAVALAQQPEKLQQARDFLLQNRDQLPLFNTTLMVRSLENLYGLMKFRYDQQQSSSSSSSKKSDREEL